MKEICIKFVFKTDREESLHVEQSQAASPLPVESDNTFGALFGKKTNIQVKTQGKGAAYIYKRDQDLDNEIRFFATLLEDTNIIALERPTKRFWEKFKKDMPFLFEHQIRGLTYCE